MLETGTMNVIFREPLVIISVIRRHHFGAFGAT
jgi:hypothetical protein